MLNEFLGGHETQHLFYDAASDGTGVRALRRKSSFVLGPEAMHDEAELTAFAALHGVIGAGRRGAMLGRPGEAEQVVIELSRLALWAIPFARGCQARSTHQDDGKPTQSAFHVWIIL